MTNKATVPQPIVLQKPAQAAACASAAERSASADKFRTDIECQHITIDVKKDVLAQIGQPPGTTAKVITEAAPTIDLAP